MLICCKRHDESGSFDVPCVPIELFPDSLKRCDGFVCYLRHLDWAKVAAFRKQSQNSLLSIGKDSVGALLSVTGRAGVSLC